ncbi:zinc-binding dehydrogenase [Bailinhaonella thermotolerans]|uniref:Oxidoreductase n=1 Tax=Bailinhaonella thermotolerans TaxID=1070861 RepID=A0A3A4BMP9_9ACTN|nr:zinc-binding dehydrogenase [Bailinhaonella thermotolerans]RJL32282.1 oxidoreductase [Bailinhaonella thermotolerans]
MFAIRQYEFGPAENLRYEEVADPETRPGTVRISVRAAGVHLVDTKIRQGGAGGPFALPELPMTPGREVAGVVDAVGDGVDPSWVGKRVVAHLGMASGGYAEKAVRELEHVHEIPADLSYEAAVAMIGTGRTTMGILEAAALTADDVVIVTAAAGGIGNLLIQEARHVGATSVGLAGGPAKVELVRGLGADVAVDYTLPDWEDEVRRGLAGREPTVLLDGVGGDAGNRALKLLAQGGRIIMFGWSGGGPLEITTEVLYAGGLTASFGIGPRVNRPGGMRPFEEAAMRAAATGRLVPLISEPFALKDAAAAHTALENRATTGKVVLIP